MACVACLGGMSALAGAAEPPRLPPLMRKLMDCRAVSAADARLACFDAQTDALGRAVDTREVVVTDRTEIRRARKSLFGLALPSLDIFGGDGRDEKGGEEEGVSQIDARIARAGRNNLGKWLIVLEDGARWEQIDDRSLPRDARAGQPIRIRRAAMGSYLANVDGQIAIRVRRIN